MDPETRWKVTSDEARREFRALLDSVLQEKAHVTISRYNTPAAVIVPVAWYSESVRIREAAERVIAQTNDRFIAEAMREAVEGARDEALSEYRARQESGTQPSSTEERQ